MNLSEFASIFHEVNQERSERERMLRWRYPLFDVIFNYCLAFLVILLGVSLIWWSGNIYKQNADRVKEEADMQAMQEEQAATEAQRQKELDDMFDRWADAGAKMLFGIRNFVDKYNYTEKDLETYLRCAWNRYLSNNKLTDLDVIIFKEDQFLACYRTGPVLPKYRDLSEKYFTEWYAESEPLCDQSYVFAELTPNGIYLTDEFGADGYAPRWKVR